MGDDQAGTAAPPQVVIDDSLGSGIEGAGGLIEDQQAGIAHQGAGDLEPLPLTAGEVPRLLGDGRSIAAAALEQIAMDGRIDARPAPAGPSATVSSQSVKLSRTEPSNMQISESTSATELTKTSRGISEIGLPS